MSAKPSLSKEELKAQQEAARAELPYTFTGDYSKQKHETSGDGHEGAGVLAQLLKNIGLNAV